MHLFLVLFIPQNFAYQLFPILLGIRAIPREIEDDGYAKFWGVNKVHHGLCENDEFPSSQLQKKSANFFLLYMTYSGCDLDLSYFGYRIRDCDSLLN